MQEKKQEIEAVEFDAIMVDLETLDTIETAAIIQIAAIEFNTKTGKTGEEFFRNINEVSNYFLGRTKCKETLEWWYSTPERIEQLNNTLKNGINLDLALSELYIFLNFLHKNPKGENLLFANPPQFDVAILVNAYRSIGIGQSDVWSPFHVQCCRTLKTQRRDIYEKVHFKGTRHNALDDCRHQIAYTVAILNEIKPKA
jgi:hypothetical protein